MFISAIKALKTRPLISTILMVMVRKRLPSHSLIPASFTGIRSMNIPTKTTFTVHRFPIRVLNLITYNVLATPGVTWDVFQINGADGTLIPLNTMNTYTKGSIAILGPTQYAAGETVIIEVSDLDVNKDTGAAEAVTVNVKSSSTDTAGISVTLKETGADTGTFERCCDNCGNL